MKDSYTLVLHVPNKAQFQIIGRGGRTIKHLQATYKCRITVPHKEDEKSEVTIVAPSKRYAEKVQEEMSDCVGFKLGTEPLVTKLLDVPSKKHGAIVGRGASTLRRIEKDTRCNVNVPRRGSKISFVEIEGPKDMIEEAHKAVEDAVGFKCKELDASASKETKKAASTLKKIDIASKPIYETLFFPDDDKEDGWNFDRFIDYLSSATKTLDICIFTITNNRIARIIKKLHSSEDVKVRIITDNLTAEALGSDTIALKDDGIPLKMDKTDHHMHHKFCVIDGTLLMNGSFNWTRSASLHNHENIMITNKSELVEDFIEEFDRLWKDGTAFE